MRKLIIFSLLLILSVACQNNESNKAETTGNEATEINAAANFVLYEVKIEGMTCTGCEETIEAGVGKVAGVGSIDANHLDGSALLKFEEGKVDTEAVKAAIETAGYTVVEIAEVTGGTPE